MIRRHRGEVVEEVEHLASCGMPPASVARILDQSPAAISRALYRAGRSDLAAPFNRLVVRRGGTCMECGAGLWDSRSTACLRHAAFARERRRALTRHTTAA